MGTGCFIAPMNTGSKGVPSQNGLLTTLGWGIGGPATELTYALEEDLHHRRSRPVAARWPKAIESSGDVEALAETVPIMAASTLSRFRRTGAPTDPYALAH